MILFVEVCCIFTLLIVPIAPQPLYPWDFASPPSSLESRYRAFKNFFLARYTELYIQSAKTYWEASISGNSSAWDRVTEISKQQNELFSNRTAFELLKQARAGNVTHTIEERRELELIYLGYLGNQADPELLNAESKLANTIEGKFNNFRTQYHGQNLTDNQVRDILKNSTNSSEVKEVWTSQKRIGEEVYADIIRVAKIRNEIAKKMGYPNYQVMQLDLGEQNPEEIAKIFDQLDRDTAQPFEKLKEGIDSYLSAKFQVPPSELMPWHYQDLFFQEPIQSSSRVDFDSIYSATNVTTLVSAFYSSIGLPIDDIVARSDLYSKPGKSQTAFCIDIDRRGDIRVLSNNQNNFYWAGTMLHEFGHAAYSKFIAQNMSFVLRDAAHIFVTEGVAMLFERQASNSAFVSRLVSPANYTEAALRNATKAMFAMGKLIFARWSQVVYRFEKALYEDPDQNLNEVWWGLVSKYQLLKKPEGRDAPDWATKVHIATTPVYYHNYLLGEVFGSQVNHKVCSEIIHEEDLLAPDYYGKPQIGDYFKQKIFGPGATYKWDQFVLLATGEPLNTKYYIEEIGLSMH